MQKLVQGIHHFQTNIFRSQRELFERLAVGQQPEALFITCSDSRINPNLITQTDPGELFILRNAGNLVPPYAAVRGGEAATVEFAVLALGVKDIIVCGHSHCGAMSVLLQPERLAELPALTDWLSHAEATRRIMKEKYHHLEGPPLVTATVEENVLVQLENLRTHPTVADGLARGDLKLHGWVYKIESGEVFAYDHERGQFVHLAEHTGDGIPASGPLTVDRTIQSDVAACDMTVFGAGPTSLRRHQRRESLKVLGKPATKGRIMPHNALLQTDLPQLNVRRGKVRDVYDLGDTLLIVASDRISAFDWVLPTGIPDKGRVLTQLSLFWFDLLKVPNHLIAGDVMQMHLPFDASGHDLKGRSMLVRKARVVPIECVVRGYLAGSGWKEYCRDGTVCGIPLPAGLTENARLPEPIFTPATKEDHGHDINISFAQMTNSIGATTAEQLRRRSLDLYGRAAEYAAQRGVIIADTKFEWGWYLDELIVIDEVLTPDSSRFWPADDYTPGRSQPSFDKQFVRDWLEQTGWDKNSPPPELPPDIVERTREKYIDAFERITGKVFDWK